MNRVCIVSIKSFHNFFKLKVVECAEEIQNRAMGREFDMNEKFVIGWRHQKPLFWKYTYVGDHAEAQEH